MDKKLDIDNTKMNNHIGPNLKYHEFVFLAEHNIPFLII